MCSGAKVAGAELTDNFKEKKMDCRGKKQGVPAAKKRKTGNS